MGLIKDRDPRRIQTQSISKLFQEVATTSHYEVFFQSLPSKLIKFIKDRDDEVTNKLMEAFYKHYFTSLNKKDAFIKAKKEIQKTYEAPIYWGAFILID